LRSVLFRRRGRSISERIEQFGELPGGPGA
jgi:hypothetical protein